MLAVKDLSTATACQCQCHQTAAWAAHVSNDAKIAYLSLFNIVSSCYHSKRLAKLTRRFLDAPFTGMFPLLNSKSNKDIEWVRSQTLALVPHVEASFDSSKAATLNEPISCPMCNRTVRFGESVQYPFHPESENVFVTRSSTRTAPLRRGPVHL